MLLNFRHVVGVEERRRDAQIYLAGAAHAEILDMFELLGVVPDLTDVVDVEEVRRLDPRALVVIRVVAKQILYRVGVHCRAPHTVATANFAEVSKPFGCSLRCLYIRSLKIRSSIQTIFGSNRLFINLKRDSPLFWIIRSILRFRPCLLEEHVSHQTDQCQRIENDHYHDGSRVKLLLDHSTNFNLI